MAEQDFKLNTKSGGKKSEIGDLWAVASQQLTGHKGDVRDALLVCVKQQLEVLKSSRTSVPEELVRIMKEVETSVTSSVVIKCIGDTVYLNTVRGYLLHQTTDKKTKKPTEKSFLVDVEIPSFGVSTKVTKKTKPLKKADEIRLQSVTKKIVEDMEKLSLQQKKPEFIEQKFLLNSDILEYRAIGFLYMAWVCMEKDFTSNIAVPYGVIVSMERFLAMLSSSVSGQSIIDPSSSTVFAETLLVDLTVSLEKLKKKYKFDGLILSKEAPQLIVESPYDVYIPQARVKPFPHQKEVSASILNPDNVKNGVFIQYCVSTNAGKTASIVNIAQAVNYLQSFGVKKTLLAVCEVKTVREMMGQWLYQSNIPFAIATMVKSRSNPCERTVKMSLGYACKGKSENCVAVVCTPEVAVKLLTEEGASDKYVAFLDEPTYDADNIESRILAFNMEVIAKAPKMFILSSATLSDVGTENPFLSHFRQRFPSARTVVVSSNTIYGSCEVKTIEQVAVLPHFSCVTREELVGAIERIETEFYGKFYTPAILLKMRDILSASPLAKPISDYLSTTFGNINNLSPNAVRETAIHILRLVSGSSDELVKLLCDPSQYQSGEVLQKMDFTKMGTTQAGLYPSMTLVATLDPKSFALTNFDSYLAEIEKRCKSFSSLMSSYDKKFSEWQDQVEKLESAKMTEIERNQAISSLMDEKPVLNFPESLQIGTREHARKYGYSFTQTRGELSLSDISFDLMNVSDQLILLLCAGVGVISGELSEYYTDAVLHFASKGHLKFVITDGSIVYGTDYPFSGVVVTEEFSRLYGLNTIHQLISRAGRGKNSLFAKVFMDDKCATRIMEDVKGVIEKGVEVTNMLSVFDKVRGL